MVGTKNTPRRSNGDIDWEEVRKQYVNPIIHSQIAPNTGRGLMYILKSKEILVKKDYKQLMVHLRDWRKNKLIEWYQIADGSGRGIINEFIDYQTPDKFIDNHVNTLRNGGDVYRHYLNNAWRWYGQKNYVEFWLEKHAIAGTVAALVGGQYVRVVFNRGNVGWGFMHDNCKRLKKELFTIDEHGNKIRRKILLRYLGDNDDAGNRMDRQIREQLEFFWDVKTGRLSTNSTN